ncbi:MAG: RNA-binding S4 domain-containing protein, partial [Acidobacteriota bacterium]
MRIDKWLWAARFFKTRSLATRACELGRVEFNGQEVKPAKDIHAGDLLRVRTEAGDFVVQVAGLSEMRGPAAAAQLLYRESDASKDARAAVAAERKAMGHPEGEREGKPSKKDRRVLGRLR